MTQLIEENKLYDRDFQKWCKATVAKLKGRDFEGLDIDNLIEEIEGLAGRDRRELESRLRVLLNHLLKRLYVSNPYDFRGWENTIEEQRSELQLLLKQSPSLKGYFLEVFNDAWQYALLRARRDYPQVQFPEQWQFNSDVEAMLSEIFWSDRSENE